MIIDMHYHLDESMEPIQRLIDQMDQHGIDRVVLIAAMVDPFHDEGTAVLAAEKYLPGQVL